VEEVVEEEDIPERVKEKESYRRKVRMMPRI
jgi:hypothetical protein